MEFFILTCVNVSYQVGMMEVSYQGVGDGAAIDGILKESLICLLLHFSQLPEMRRNYLGENGEVCEPLVRLVVGQIKVRLWLDFIGCGGAFNNFELPETILRKSGRKQSGRVSSSFSGVEWGIVRRFLSCESIKCGGSA